MLHVIIGALLFLALGETAHAHFLWLERDGDGPARAYFGEWIDDIREKTGGLLDRFKAPRAFLGASSEALLVKRNDNHLEIGAKGRGDVRFVDSGVPAREDKEKGGATKTIYYARAGRAETAAKLDLEPTPTAANGNTLVLMFLGAPLPKAEVTIVGPSKWQKPLVTDDKGQITVLYPADFTFICPTELEEAAEYYGEFKKETAEILSVSTDTVFVHKAWHDNSPLIKKSPTRWSPIK